jgi:3alpha(or 20beta)-hydroxysteroid dehydrogenase
LPAERLDGMQDCVVLISGGARGQGAAQARLLAAKGASVVIGDLLEDAGHDVVDDITASGGDATFSPLDVTDERSWASIVAGPCAQGGGLAALVNNAGVSDRSTIEELTFEMFQHLMSVNLYGCVLGIKAAISPMRQRGGGAIVNISSIAGQTAWPSAGYAMSKWGLTGLTKVAAHELGPLNIRVNSVHPGVIETDMADGLSTEFKDSYRQSVPLGRIGVVKDVAPLVAFLCSPEAAYLTGAEIAVDGGFVAAGAARGVFGRI